MALIGLIKLLTARKKKQRATSELKLAISNESTLIEAALMSAKREIEREQFRSGLQPDELKRFDQHHLELTQGYSGKHIDENDGLKQLPNAEIPKFDYPNRDPDDRTADAIEGEIRSLKEQRSRRLVRLITELAADHELMNRFHGELDALNAKNISSTIAQMAENIEPPNHQTQHNSFHGAKPIKSLSLSSESKGKIGLEIRRRNIPNLLHFTRAENLPSILKYGLKSVAALKKHQIDYIHNDASRYDGHIEAISLSIAHPNEKMFFKYRMSKPEQEWVVLVLNPDVLSSTNAAFCRCNAADVRMSRLPLPMRMTACAFSEMFEFPEDLPARMAAKLHPFEPSDVQAEVLVFDTLRPRMITGIVFSNAKTLDRYQSLLGDRQISVHTKHSGYFGLRSDARRRTDLF